MVERQTYFDKEDLLACARGEMFGPGNAQLPLPPMLMADRITDIPRMAASSARAISSRSSISTPICGSSPAISPATR